MSVKPTGNAMYDNVSKSYDKHVLIWVELGVNKVVIVGEQSCNTTSKSKIVHQHWINQQKKTITVPSN